MDSPLGCEIIVDDSQFQASMARLSNLRPFWTRFYDRIGLLGEKTMKEYETAVLSGNLRSSIRHDIVSWGVRIAPATDYAQYIEFGTRRNRKKFGPRGLRYAERTRIDLVNRIPGLAKEMLAQHLAGGG